MENIKCAHDKIVDIDSLIANPRNPNKHPERQIEMLAKIIKHQGQRSPVVVSNRSGFIVKGHGRLEAIQALGWPQIAVDYQDYESEAQEFQDMVADNKIAELADHDDSFMIESIGDLELGGSDFELMGLDDFDLEDFDVINQVNYGDENSEWVGLPEFKEGSDYIKIIYHFKTEKERELFAKEKDITPTMKKAGAWIVHI